MLHDLRSKLKASFPSNVEISGPFLAALRELAIYTSQRQMTCRPALTQRPAIFMAEWLDEVCNISPTILQHLPPA
jgi:hypothetical protein